jgi:hypothetical protein
MEKIPLKANAGKKMICLVCIVGTLFMAACGTEDRAQAEHEKKESERPVSNLPPLKKAFVLREGRKSDITCMVVDHKGNVYAAGLSNNKCVIFKLDPKLNNIKGLVKFGSARRNTPITDMAVDSHNNIFVTGYTKHTDFPVTEGCYDNSLAPDDSFFTIYEDGFVAKFSPELKMLASTFIGSEGEERVYAIAIDRHDDIYVAGYAEGVDARHHTNFVPPEGAFDAKPAPDDQAKALVAKLNNDLTTLKAATLLGGNKKKRDSDDEAYDLAIDSDGNVWVAGQSNSDDFPVTIASVGTRYAGKGDVFISKLDTGLGRLLASTYLGGMNQEMATAIVLDRKGNAFVGGWTESPDLPMVPGCFDTKYSHEEEDAFIVKLSGDLKQLMAATYLGGDYDASGYGDDLLSAMTLSSDGKLLAVSGRTESENFPVTPKCYKNYTNDNDTAIGSENHRNEKKPRESSSDDEDYGDGFITLFNADLTQCRYSTYLGGDNLEYTDDILFDGDDLLVAGITYSYDFPRITTKEKSKAYARGFAIRFDWKKSR